MRPVHPSAESGDEKLGDARQSRVVAEGDIGPERRILLDRNDSEAEAVLFGKGESIDHPDAEILADERADCHSEPRFDGCLISKPGAGENVGYDRPVGVARLDPNQRMGDDLRGGDPGS